jgi:hypothetical protein
MSRIIQGTYKNGAIFLDHLPDGVGEARVAVEFLEQGEGAPKESARRRGIAHFGMFAPADGQFTSDEELEEVKKSWNVKLDALES